jgi:pyruvoyl-dependent arginine decarboxylase (PvlArgDC)
MITQTKQLTASATGDKKGNWTTVVAAAILLA